MASCAHKCDTFTPRYFTTMALMFDRFVALTECRRSVSGGDPSIRSDVCSPTSCREPLQCPGAQASKGPWFWPEDEFDSTSHLRIQI